MPSFSWSNWYSLTFAGAVASKRQRRQGRSNVNCIEQLECRTLLSANQAPDIHDQAFYVLSTSENGTLVGSVDASDPDAGDELSFRISGGNANKAFEIEADTGRLRVKDMSKLDAMIAPAVLTVIVSDNGSPELSDTASFTVYINHPPKIKTDPKTGVVQFSSMVGSDHALGTVSVTDSDPGQTLTYSILTGNEAGIFQLNSATGRLTVSDIDAFNSLTFPKTLAIRVQDSSSASGFLTASDTALVKIVGNTSPSISAQSFSVAPNVTSGAAVGIVKATDVDAGQVLAYSIVGGNATGAFKIDSGTGKITIVNITAFNALEFPATLTVQVADDGTNPPGISTAQITISNDGLAFFSLAKGTRTYRVGAPPVRIDPQTDFHLGSNLPHLLDNGTLTVRLNTADPFQTSGKVSVVSDAPGNGRLSVVGKSVLFGNTVVGTIQKGLDTGPGLEIRFTPSITAAAVQALIRRIGFQAHGPAGQREVELTVTGVSTVPDQKFTQSRIVDVVKKH